MLQHRRVIGLTILALGTACSDSSSPGNPVTIVLNFCGDAPSFMAYQSEGAGWTRLTADGNGTVDFQAAGRVSLLLVDATSASFAYPALIMASAEELQTLESPCLDDVAGTKLLSGSIAGATGDETAYVELGAETAVLPPGTTSYNLFEVPEGSLDLIAELTTDGVNDQTATAMIIRRERDYPDNSEIPLLDFAATEAFALENHALTTNTVTADNAVEFEYFMTAAGSAASLTFRYLAGAPPVLLGVPASRLEDGDLHFVRVATNSFEVSRSALRFFENAGDMSVLLGQEPAVPTFTVAASTPYLRPRAQLASQADYPDLVYFGFIQFTQSPRVLDLIVTRGYFGGTTPATWDITVPDMSGLSGFQSSWMPEGSNAAVYTSVFRGSLRWFEGFRPEAGDVITEGDRYQASLLGSPLAVRQSGAPNPPAWGTHESALGRHAGSLVSGSAAAKRLRWLRQAGPRR